MGKALAVVTRSGQWRVAGASLAVVVLARTRMQTKGKDQEDEESTTTTVKETPILSTGMIGALGFYKQIISPLLPPACRFVPTCSQYGVQAITEFGPSRGAVLIAWRLLRCSPVGGQGYDPPRWPPVQFTYGRQ